MAGEEGKSLLGIGSEAAHGAADIADTGLVEQRKDVAIENSHDQGGWLGSELGGVFV